MTGTEPQLTWNIVDDVRQVLEYPFMVNAFRAGAIVAVLAGLVGWFMVLRRQSFAGHTLAVVGFPGAAGAVLLVAAVVIGLVPVAAGRSYSEESAVTGTVNAFALACGYLFVALYGGFVSGANALLFGSFLGVSASQVVVLLVVAALTLSALALVARPLLFASVDPAVAAARGVPVRLLSVGFLVLLGLAAAEVSQITGTLLVFALLVVPAAAAQSWTAHPAVGALLAVAVGVAVVWVSLFVAYFSSYPIGFLVTTVAFAVYLLAVGSSRAARLRAAR
jgi:zinc/manganese transport system permease protein